MDKLVDEFWLLDGGRLSSFSGDMGEYVALKKESVIEAKSSQTPDKESKENSDSLGERETTFIRAIRSS